MKTMLLLLGSLLFATALPAQETLISGDMDFGGFGGPFVQFTSINNQFGLLVGGGGGVIIDHTISIGGAGYGLASNVTEESAPLNRPYVNMGYGGVFLQYINRSNDLIHVTGGALVGGGGVGYRAAYGGNTEGPSNYGDEMNDAFFVVEPNVEGVLNVARYFRLGVGISYRYISGIEAPGLRNADFEGAAARITFNFGSF